MARALGPNVGSGYQSRDLSARTGACRLQSRGDETAGTGRSRSGGSSGTETCRRRNSQAVQTRLAALQIERRHRTALPKVGGRPVIDTSFRMDVGETVVVGTSGLKGGSKALIALLTAVPAKSKAR